MHQTVLVPRPIFAHVNRNTMVNNANLGCVTIIGTFYLIHVLDMVLVLHLTTVYVKQDTLEINVRFITALELIVNLQVYVQDMVPVYQLTCVPAILTTLDRIVIRLTALASTRHLLQYALVMVHAPTIIHVNVEQVSQVPNVKPILAMVWYTTIQWFVPHMVIV